MKCFSAIFISGCFRPRRSACRRDWRCGIARHVVKQTPMSTPSAAVIDALNSLLEAEANSIFHFVGAGSPYLDHAGPEIRQPLEEMRRHLDQHEAELSQLIRELGGEPSTPPKPRAEDQYLN